MYSRAIEVLSKCVTTERIQKIDYVLEKRTSRIRLVLENITDPHNQAACLRTAEGKIK